jgi:arsenate reductase
MNHLGREEIVGYSAGSHPKGAIHPIALELLEQLKLPTETLRSKSWNEFALPGAPRLDFVITVCDNAAGETCPIWPGQPLTAHWEIADPAAVQGSDAERRAAFRTAFDELDRRIKMLASPPLRSLNRVQLQERLNAIGRTGAQNG